MNFNQVVLYSTFLYIYIVSTKTGNVKVAVQNIVQGQRNKNSGHLGFNEKTEIYDPNSDGPDL